MATPDLVNLGYFIVTLIVGVIVGLYGPDIRGAFSRNYTAALKKAIADLERLEHNASAMVAECAYRAVLCMVFIGALFLDIIIGNEFDQLGYIYAAINVAKFGKDLGITKDWWLMEGGSPIFFHLGIALFVVIGFVLNLGMLMQYKDTGKAKTTLQKKIKQHESRAGRA